VRLQFRPNRTPRSAARNRRSAHGMYLLETLVALTVGGFISFALLDVLCGAMRTMQTSSNETTAAEILDEVSEQTRGYGYPRLINYVGKSISLVVDGTAVTSNPDNDLHTRPLSLDFLSKRWQPRTQSNSFGEGSGGAVLYTVTTGPASDSINVKIDVSWNDANSASRRELSRTIVLFNTD